MKLKASLLVFASILVLGSIANADETCSWKPDGTQVCEEETTHNVWTETSHNEDEKAKIEKEKDATSSTTIPKRIVKADDDILNYFKDNGVDLNKLEVSLLLDYIDTGKDGQVDISDLESIQNASPVQFVEKAIDCFNRIDLNDDGKLSKKELKAIHEDFESLRTIFKQKYKETQLLILDYLQIISKLDLSVKKVLSPFLKLDFISPIEIKKVMSSSSKMFSDTDLDKSGGLNKEEYSKTMDRPENVRGKSLDEKQKEAIFDLLDLDKDGEISYLEFQAIMPQRPKDIKQNLLEVFRNADLDGDGYWSEEEFQVHLRTMAEKMGGNIPSDAEIEEAFNQLDKDEDGKVSQVEMQGVQGEIEKLQEAKAIQGFKDMDTDENGILSRDEMVAMAAMMKERSGGRDVDVDLLIKMLDKNQDGLIQLEEVQNLAKRMQPPG